MKESLLQKIRIFIQVIILITSCKAFCSDQKDIELSEYFNNQKSIENITVVLIPQNWSFRKVLSEDLFLKIGCTYKTNDISLINDIGSILSRSNLKIESRSNSIYDLRYGIFITLFDKNMIKILFGEPFSGQTTVGGIFSNSEKNKNISFSASKSLPIDLMEWAQRVGLSDSKNIEYKAACLRDIH